MRTVVCQCLNDETGQMVLDGIKANALDLIPGPVGSPIYREM